MIKAALRASALSAVCLVALASCATAPSVVEAARANDSKMLSEALDAYEPNVDEFDEGGWAPLHYAAKAGSRDAIQKILSGGAKLETLTKKGETPLYVACALGKQDAALLLLEKGADPRKARADGNSPLTAAIYSKSWQAVQKIVEKGVSANVAINSQGETLLIQASREGNESLALALLKAGADPNIRDKQGLTALSHAWEGGRQSLVGQLLAYGANADTKTKNGETLLVGAIRKRDVKGMSSLLASGARARDALDFADTGKEGMSVFVPLLLEGRYDCVDVLVGAGLDILARDVSGVTSLHWLALYGLRSTVKILPGDAGGQVALEFPTLARYYAYVSSNLDKIKVRENLSRVRTQKPLSFALPSGSTFEGFKKYYAAAGSEGAFMTQRELADFKVQQARAGMKTSISNDQLALARELAAQSLFNARYDTLPTGLAASTLTVPANQGIDELLGHQVRILKANLQYFGVAGGGSLRMIAGQELDAIGVRAQDQAKRYLDLIRQTFDGRSIAEREELKAALDREQQTIVR